MIILITSLISLVLIVFVILYFFQEKLIFHPEKLPEDHRYEFPCDFKEVNIVTQKGARINALHFFADDPKGVVLYFHGNSGSLNDWGHIAEHFTSNDFDLFIPGYRSFGKSTGNLGEQALHHDAEKIYTYLLDRYEEKKIIVYGRSLGSGIATKIASSNSPQLLILETPYYSLLDMAKRHFPFVPHRFILRYTFRTDIWIKKVKCPLHIFHGTMDEVIPYESAIELCKLLKRDSILTTIEGAMHNNLADYSQYHEKLGELLLQANQNSNTPARTPKSTVIPE